MNKPELLAPVGMMDCMYAAVNNGCDAVYFGGKDFNARGAAQNFTDEELEYVIDYCHERGVRSFVTVNTLYKTNELNALLDFCAMVYEFGADAFIVQDLGTARLLMEQLPGVNIHASTQMTVHSMDDVRYVKELGFSRAVLNREMPLSEIKEICATNLIETEMFAHGALCVSYSGQCLISSMLGQRSGNRGRCAQTCRMRYDLLQADKKIKSGYLLSPKDLITLTHLPEIVRTGVTSLKIEGRMKSPDYVALITKTYREYLERVVEEADYEVSDQDLMDVTQIFNRGGSFTEGYTKHYSGADMMSSDSPKSSGVYIGKVVNVKRNVCQVKLSRPVAAGDGIEIWTRTEPHTGTNLNHAGKAGDVIVANVADGVAVGDFVYKSFDKTLHDQTKRLYAGDSRKIVVDCAVSARLGKPLSIKLCYQETNVTMEGCVVEAAQNKPLTKEALFDRLSKTGNTPFLLSFDEQSVVDDGIFIDIKSINALRRDALDLLGEQIVTSYKRRYRTIQLPSKRPDKNTGNPHLTVSVMNREQLLAVLDTDSKWLDRIYFEWNSDIIRDLDSLLELAKSKGKKLYAALPAICRKSDRLEAMVEQIEASAIDGYLVRTHGELQRCKQSTKPKVVDYRLNVFNALTRDLYSDLEAVTLSPELSMRELFPLADQSSEILAYGAIPLMTTQQCPVGLYAGEKNSNQYCRLKNQKNEYVLRDRKDMSFRIVTDCNACIAYILNSLPLFMLNKMEDMQKLGAGHLRLLFTTEDPQSVKELILGFEQALNGYTNTELINQYLEKGITYGQFFRGV